MNTNKIENLIIGDSTQELSKITSNSVDLIYLDPPFFTQKEHSLKSRDNKKEYKFDDKWEDLTEYLSLIKETLIECHRILKNTGSIFLHCDKSASHHIRILLDEIFGYKNFQSEIIWAYKRWSNSKKGLLNAHQNIYFYSKSVNFQFNTIYTDYSPTTNIDQILQSRIRNEHGKSVYQKDNDGNTILGKEKKGVPLSDVWNIPFLNPKANERVGYPTQKPVLLLKQIIQIASNESDLILDPFCGSGTTCVAAKLLNRKFIGIDISTEAIELTTKRLSEMIVSDSMLLSKGEESYIEKSAKELAILESIEAIPVQRNSGIDGFLREYIDNKPVPVKIQGENESLQKSIEKLKNTTKSNKYEWKILIKTNALEEYLLFDNNLENENIFIIDSYDLVIKKYIKNNKHYHLLQK